MPTIDHLLQELAHLQDQLAAVASEHAAHREAALPARVRARLADLDATYAPQVECLERVIAAQTTQLKHAVLAHGHSVKGHGLQAVFMPGRCTWNDAGLQGYSLVHPEILTFRRVGPPGVSLRQSAQTDEGSHGA
jgi:hypothetical protein